TTVDNRKLIFQSQLATTALAFSVAKLEQRKIHAARDHFVMDRTATESRPLFNDGPDALGQGHDTVSGREDASLGGLRKTIRNTTFTPVLRVDILLGHQPSHVEDHLDAET